MAPGNTGAARLASRLRDLRVKEWPDAGLTQEKLAKALGTQERVAPATLASWESRTSPKTPTPVRLNAYARFFATRKSIEGGAHLVPLTDLDDAERARFEELRTELLGLHAALVEAEAVEDKRRALLYFEDGGPIVIICPEAPEDSRGPLADENHINYVRLHRYADIDALIEMFGHIRALNPEMHVHHRLPDDVQQNELQNHLVLLGGIGWNSTTRRILAALKRQLPVEQVDDPSFKGGDVFRVTKAENRDEATHLPVMEEFNGVMELVDDVGFIARVANPFNSSRTLTICNGVHSRGVVGAVLTLTDETVRPANERYLAERFPEGDFAMLVKVPVVARRVLAPDLENPDAIVFEWSPLDMQVTEGR